MTKTELNILNKDRSFLSYKVHILEFVEIISKLAERYSKNPIVINEGHKNQIIKIVPYFAAYFKFTKRLAASTLWRILLSTDV